MFNKLGELIKKTSGNVLVIGLEQDLIDKFNSNNKINLYSIDSGDSNGIIGKIKKNKKKNTNQGKKINIKKLRKYINKESVDYLFINIEKMYDYYKYLIKDTIYLCNNKIYVYATNNIDKDFIISRYKRYNVEISVTDYKNGYIIIIDDNNGKTSKLKDIRYFISDTLYNIAEFIGNVLIS